MWDSALHRPAGAAGTLSRAGPRRQGQCSPAGSWVPPRGSCYTNKSSYGGKGASCVVSRLAGDALCQGRGRMAWLGRRGRAEGAHSKSPVGEAADTSPAPGPLAVGQQSGAQPGPSLPGTRTRSRVPWW
ncbi:coiled-coil domain-containing protein 61 [Platysternon megacephalum]|uniref:Coiled-coil domain-containing protein 61 n=1 Tax=Platysternon megacephalum TaxID=55544 RepID=A0A4D9DMV2_9SAUR|nr:coiled-coil domain-containing protein 61 [Platysternon megacephalum]